MSNPVIPVSWGELVDKMSILEIKSERLTGMDALAHVRHELALLREIAQPSLVDRHDIGEIADQLKSVNEALWDNEERIRRLELEQRFDAPFVALARSIYRLNDQRARLKRDISQRLDSGILEIKSY
jgi:hypothetical protein